MRVACHQKYKAFSSLCGFLGLAVNFERRNGGIYTPRHFLASSGLMSATGKHVVGNSSLGFSIRRYDGHQSHHNYFGTRWAAAWRTATWRSWTRAAMTAHIFVECNAARAAVICRRDNSVRNHDARVLIVFASPRHVELDHIPSPGGIVKASDRPVQQRHSSDHSHFRMDPIDEEHKARLVSYSGRRTAVDFEPSNGSVCHKRAFVRPLIRRSHMLSFTAHVLREARAAAKRTSIRARQLSADEHQDKPEQQCGKHTFTAGNAADSRVDHAHWAPSLLCFALAFLF
mmetsp:Transcript_6556/g.17583  ORF Transcript_6556/g.17583 Transcript_6556/m.17583 type:complete len:286 (-) Transcript_6556:182-1039(-)